MYDLKYRGHYVVRAKREEKIKLITKKLVKKYGFEEKDFTKIPVN